MKLPATEQELLALITRIKGTLISVATGGARINEVNAEFQADAEVLRVALQQRGLDNPLPFLDLWVWHGIWSNGDMPKWAERRAYVAKLFDPLVKRLGSTSMVSFEPTGWARVDRNVEEIRARFAQARTEEQYQAVGLLCREAVISAAQAVYDPEQHPSPEGVKISETDAKRMFDVASPWRSRAARTISCGSTREPHWTLQCTCSIGARQRTARRHCASKRPAQSSTSLPWSQDCATRSETHTICL